MSTISGLLLHQPQFAPFDLGRSMQQANQIAGGRTANETALLQLAEMRRQQEAEALMRQAIAQNPDILLGGGGGMPQSTIASLGAPGAGALTQGPLPGMPGQTQTIGAPQDLSRYAGVSPQGGGPIPPDVAAQVTPTVTPPQSTLGTLGQPQAPPDPVRALLQQNPQAGMQLMQMQQREQDRRWKLQEQQLDIGVKVSEAVARQLQGVTDQASLDEARERIRLIHPQAAAQIPQFYSKEGVEAVQQRGIAVADVAKWRKDMATARQTEVTTEHLPKVFGALEQFATGTSGGQEPAPTGTTQTDQPPATRQQVASAPPEFESAITDANRLYPQVPVARIKSIIAAESNFDPKAVSSAGAQGPMQLMPGTAKDMGVDDPFNIAQNVRGGTRYYAELLTKYGGDERKALAAYNWGPGNLDKVGGDVSKAPPETQAYVQKVLGGSGGTSGGGGIRTAQAPATDPRIAQLQARIDQGNKAALQAELVGMEGPARQIRAQVAQLEAERTRLEEHSTEPQRAAQRVTAEERARYGEKARQQSGPMLPEAKREYTMKLRSDIRQEPTHKLYQDVRNGYQNVRIGAESNSAQGDLAIINGMAKILDPGSVVMTGEAKTVEEAQGQLERWFGLPQRFFEGDRLTPENRQKFLALAHSMAKEKLTTARTELSAIYEPLAKEGNIPFGQILPLEDLKPIGAASAGEQTAGGSSNVEKFKNIKKP